MSIGSFGYLPEHFRSPMPHDLLSPQVITGTGAYRAVSFPKFSECARRIARIPRINLEHARQSRGAAGVTDKTGRPQTTLGEGGTSDASDGPGPHRQRAVDIRAAVQRTPGSGQRGRRLQRLAARRTRVA